jgi:hypothetical protein
MAVGVSYFFNFALINVGRRFLSAAWQKSNDVAVVKQRKG